MDYPKSVPSVGLVGGKFVDEDPIAGTPGSLIPAQWGNGVTQEVLNVLNAAGILPDEFDNAQLLLAISNLSVISQAQYVLSSGTANAIAANYSPAVTALTDGMVLKFKALSVNTGAATFNPNALGAKPIVGGAHNALQGGEITANGDVWLQYNASLGGGSWVLIASTGGGVQFAAGAYGGTALQFDNSKKFATTEFVRQAGFQFSQTTQYTSGPRALIASQAGSFIDLAGSYTGDITLPALSSVPDGANFYIWSGASASLNVIRSGADQIFVNGTVVNSIAMNNGDTLVIGKSSPAGAWVAMWGSAQFPYSAVYAGLAPKPITVPGRGAWQANVAGVNTPLVAPAGGTWAVFALPFASGGLSQTGVAPIATVVAGGSTITAAVSGQYWYGFFWRLQ